MNSAYKALFALKQKYSKGIPNVFELSDEQKAWLVIKIQAIAEEAKTAFLDLKKIGERLSNATEDIPDEELQKIVMFVFSNMEEIKTKLFED